MEHPQRKDTWASGATYEPYVGRWSRLVAREFLAWLAIPPGARWLDIGCGTGVLSQTILDVASPREITGIDPSEGYITFARQQVPDRRVSFRLGGAQALPEASASYDAVVAGLVLNFVPQPSRAVAEMQRVARVGGTVAAYVWDYAGQMQLMRYFWDAAVALDPCPNQRLQQLSAEEGHKQLQHDFADRSQARVRSDMAREHETNHHRRDEDADDARG